LWEGKNGVSTQQPYLYAFKKATRAVMDIATRAVMDIATRPVFNTDRCIPEFSLTE
jgi:hypothetical protein